MTERIQAITMPKWGLSMEEGTVVAWHVETGDEIHARDEILDIETSKITNGFESPVGGTLRRRAADEGATVPVGGLLAVVAEASVSEPEIDAFIKEFQAGFAVTAARTKAERPQAQTATVDGRPVNYLSLGEADGAPLVLVHGFGGDINSWMFNLPVLAERGRVIAFDLPGHGGSSKDVGAGDLASFAGALDGLLAALGIERAHLAGHSLGGAVALTLALDRPGLVASLSLVAPAGLGSEINNGYIEGFIAATRRKELKEVLRALFADPEGLGREMVNEVLKYKRLDGVDAALRKIAGAVFPGGRQIQVARDRLGALEMPVQIIWGTQDRILPAAHANGLPPEIAVHTIDRAGHMVHMEAAGEVNRLIAKFIA